MQFNLELRLDCALFQSSFTTETNSVEGESKVWKEGNRPEARTDICHSCKLYKESARVPHQRPKKEESLYGYQLLKLMG